MSTKEYFQAYEGYFWQWEDKGDVMAIPNGATIIYREYLSEVIEHLAPQGLPLLGALLLTIVATNPEAETNLHILERLTYDLIPHQDSIEERYQGYAFEFLSTLSKLPPEYKQGKKRLLLLQTIFQEAHNHLGYKKSKRIYEDLRDNRHINYESIQNDNLRFATFIKEMTVLNHSDLSEDTEEEIIQKIASLPEIPDPIEIETQTLLEEKPAKDFIEALKEHQNTFQIGASVQYIWGSVHLPMHPHIPSEQALGGVSDITNRGTWDKLLTSEFAHDDLIFISRLATREALFFNREKPPTNHHYERYLLIDVSLKNWGNIKTILFALATAFTYHPKSNLTHHTFVLDESYKAVSLADIHQVIAALQFLGTSVHAGKGLLSFFEKEDLKGKEVVFLTSKEAYSHAEFQKLVSQESIQLDYLIQADKEGNVSVFKHRNKQKKHLQDIKIPIEELWKNPPKSKQPKSTQNSENPSLFFPDYPLLLPKSQSYRCFCVAPDGVWFYVSKEKKLLRKYHEKKAWEVIVENLPFSPTTMSIGINQEQEYVVLLYNVSLKEILLLNLHTREEISLPFEEWKQSQSHFVFQNERFYYARSVHFWAISLDGTITNDSIPSSREYMQKYNEEKNKFSVSATTTILKNIHKIFINEYAHLVFNIHELALVKSHNRMAYPIFRHNKGKISVYKGTVNDYNTFIFDEGSQITINPLGVLTFVSSNPDIPEFSILSALNMSFVGASEDYFAGDDYYSKIFRNPADYAKKTQGSKYNTSSEAGQVEMSSNNFYNKYIEKFITHIKSHATSN